jgi:type II secretory pathway component PulK
MITRNPHLHDRSGRAAEGGSVLVIVMLIAFGLIAMALYFANSMTMELRASDNRASGLAAEQAIEGGARYVTSMLTTYATNGAVPDPSEYLAEAVPVGDSKVPEENAHFWLIGRDPDSTAPSSEPTFRLVDEASKLDLNASWLTADMLATNLPGMTYDFAEAIMEWRDTNGGSSSLNYSQLGYLPKQGPFETVGELRLVYGATMDELAGDDLNRNGVLDANEVDQNGNGQADPGAMEYFTVYSRQPNTHSDGTALTNVNTQADLQALLEDRLGASRAGDIIRQLFGNGAGGTTPGGTGTQTGYGSVNSNMGRQAVGTTSGGGVAGGVNSYTNLLQFYLASGMTLDEFGQIYNDVTASTNAYAIGRVNINTAPAAVLACLPGLDADLAQQLVNYRESNPATLTSIAWIVDALGTGSQAVTTLAEGDYITTQSYQFSADIAGVGPFGRGYRRVRFVFDLSDGTPKIIFRQDLSRLGWALGKQTRETWVAQNTR